MEIPEQIFSSSDVKVESPHLKKFFLEESIKMTFDLKAKNRCTEVNISGGANKKKKNILQNISWFGCVLSLFT